MRQTKEKKGKMKKKKRKKKKKKKKRNRKSKRRRGRIRKKIRKKNMYSCAFLPFFQKRSRISIRWYVRPSVGQPIRNELNFLEIGYFNYNGTK